LAPISGLSENAFKTVIDIDLVRQITFSCPPSSSFLFSSPTPFTVKRRISPHRFVFDFEGLSADIDIDIDIALVVVLLIQLGTYNTIKATIPYVRQSRGSYIHISATLHYRGQSPPLRYVARFKL
jgi:NAD(P)-dependent dehydrogenase (short-subunit alcohol dehydrogenase family)